MWIKNNNISSFWIFKQVRNSIKNYKFIIVIRISHRDSFYNKSLSNKSFHKKNKQNYNQNIFYKQKPLRF